MKCICFWLWTCPECRRSGGSDAVCRRHQLQTYRGVGSQDFLIGRSPGPQCLAKVENLARSVEGVLGVHDLRAGYIGPGTVHTGMHIEVQRGIPVEEADPIAEEVRERIHGETGCLYCVIPVDAADSLKGWISLVNKRNDRMYVVVLPTPGQRIITQSHKVY